VFTQVFAQNNIKTQVAVYKLDRDNPDKFMSLHRFFYFLL